MAGTLKLRTGQRGFMRGIEEHRMVALLARRQYGKTTIFSAIALKKMMRKRGHTVIFGSAKLSLAREIVRKEAAIIQSAIMGMQQEAEAAAGMVTVNDGRTGKAVEKLGEDDFAEMFEAQRLEFRFWHTRSIYSRTKVVALLPDTVGETGDLMADEIGRVKNWREVWEAIEPIVSSDPEFRVLFCTTPPPDDTHYSFEMLAPPIGVDFPVNPAGNWYRSELGVWVLRIDAFDAWADGVPVYDMEKGKALTPEEHRKRAHDKDAWDRNYGVRFVIGGTAAVGILQLDTAQRRGIGKCACVQIETDDDMDRALQFLAVRLGSGKVGLGWDLATTEKETSNPSAFTVTEENGVEWSGIVTFTWKTNDPAIAEDRAERIIDTVARRPAGGKARALCVDATNERYFAVGIQRKFRAKVPVVLVIGSETIQRPGMEEPMTMKQFLGSMLVSEIDDNHATLPPERYLRDDFRLVKRDRGSFNASLGPEGQHGDTFDAHKLALWALKRRGADAQATAMQVGNYGADE